MKAAVRWNATVGLAASADAAASLFGPRWRDDERWRVCHCGIDLSPFRVPVDRNAVRAELRIPPTALVVGHVGRLAAPKNHGFLLRVAAEVVRMDPRVFFVLVGEGPLRERIEREAAELAIRERILLTGSRADVPRVLRAFDAFLLPSAREGLPLVALEAQAAALPIVLTDTITRELVVCRELFSWRSLSDSPRSWASALLAALARERPTASAVLAQLERSDFALDRSLRTLEDAYGV
jgi:glycosyltransferase involved in cell wall biosynthesis